MNLLKLFLLCIPTDVVSFSFRGGDEAGLHSPNQRKMHFDRRSLCPTGRDDDRKKYIIKADDRFRETSYIAYSQQTYEGHAVIWIGSDGEQNTVSAADLLTGKRIRTYDLPISKEGDWESISLGPCNSTTATVCIYAGNTGDNRARRCVDKACDDGRPEIEIYKFEEPNLSDNSKSSSVLSVTTLALKYNTENCPTNRADSEALFVDHTGDLKGGLPGDIYLVTKWYGSDKKHLGRLAKISVKEHESLDANKHNVKMSCVAKPSVEKMWTGGDMRQDGYIIALRTPTRVVFFPRLPYETVAEAVKKDPCKFTSKTKRGGDEKQHEAVAMIGSDVAEASECTGSKSRCDVAISIYELEYNK